MGQLKISQKKNFTGNREEYDKFLKNLLKNEINFENSPVRNVRRRYASKIAFDWLKIVILNYH